MILDFDFFIPVCPGCVYDEENDMCTLGCLQFGEKYLSTDEVKGKRVIEVGSYNVNGSPRAHLETLRPSEYIGVDIEEGNGVDVVCRAEDVRKMFGDNSFDVVVSTEMIEHVRDWRTILSNLKNLCRPNGVILVTTRSFGYRYHGWPYDFWRYEASDMERIFSDCRITNLEQDEAEPGVFIKVIKPADFRENNLSDVELYSVVTGTRSKNIDESVLKEFLDKRKDECRSLEKVTIKGRVRRRVRDSYWKIKKLARSVVGSAF
jgi:SAM-dependent methyltransferase